MLLLCRRYGLIPRVAHLPLRAPSVPHTRSVGRVLAPDGLQVDGLLVEAVVANVHPVREEPGNCVQDRLAVYRRKRRLRLRQQALARAEAAADFLDR